MFLLSFNEGDDRVSLVWLLQRLISFTLDTLEVFFQPVPNHKESQLTTDKGLWFISVDTCVSLKRGPFSDKLLLLGRVDNTCIELMS